MGAVVAINLGGVALLGLVLAFLAGLIGPETLQRSNVGTGRGTETAVTTNEPNRFRGNDISEALGREMLSIGAAFRIDCPASIEASAGQTFTCTLSDPDWPDFLWGRAELEVQSSEGDIYWRTINTRPRSNLGDIDPSLEGIGDGPSWWETEGFIRVSVR